MGYTIFFSTLFSPILLFFIVLFSTLLMSTLLFSTYKFVFYILKLNSVNIDKGWSLFKMFVPKSIICFNQEARKIVGAVIQKITYCEWLPIILGPELMEKYKLGCARRSKYNPYVDPRISNSFSAG